MAWHAHLVRHFISTENRIFCLIQNAQRKALDVINTLGISGTVLRRIDRRQLADKWISYIGMLITVVIVIVVWRWTR